MRASNAAQNGGRNLAVIPARGGSKRIPRKNLRDFCGMPMIARTIKAAVDSNCFDRIVVSTDDAQIADVSRQYGADVPFIRPAELADDYVPLMPVVRHAAEWCRENDDNYGRICCLSATAPLLRSSDIRDGLNALVDAGSKFAVAVTRYAFPVQRAVRISANGRLIMFCPEEFTSRSQDLETAYHDAAQFYWGTKDAWFSESIVFSEAAVPVILPRIRVQDIDEPEDWAAAEAMFRALHGD